MNLSKCFILILKVKVDQDGISIATTTKTLITSTVTSTVSNTLSGIKS